MERSCRTESQLSSSVSALLMPSSTSKSLLSSTEISYSVSSSGIVSRVSDRTSQPLQRACARWCFRCESPLAALPRREDGDRDERVGDVEGVDRVEELLVDSDRGRIWSR